MYDLSKAYKTKAMAVNAIRMTATNKGWKVLSTDEAATHVWPTAEGFVVNNTTLNLALGFITEAEASVAEALAEQAPKDKAAPKLQAPSKVGEGKKAAKAAKKAAKENSEPKAPTRCETKNGARRPLRGKTLLVWETAERMYNESGEVPSMKQVHEELLKTEPGFNKTTTGIQYYACKAYNSWADKK